MGWAALPYEVESSCHQARLGVVLAAPPFTMRFYLTTPIYYVNAAPHLGHAYTTLLADAAARAPPAAPARTSCSSPAPTSTVRRSSGRRGRRGSSLARSSTASPTGSRRSSRTCTSATTTSSARRKLRHRRAVEAIWRTVAERGDLYKAKYEGWYCTTDELYVPETQLVDGKRCPTCGSAVEWLEEENYKFRLSKYQQPLLDLYRTQPDFVVPAARYNEVLAFVERGLDDLSVSRTSFTWGIPVPDDPGHVVYVWFDALTNYLTAVGYGDPTAERRRRGSRSTGLRTCTSSARRSSASTPSTGPRSSCPPACRCLAASSRTGGGRWTGRRCRSRWATWCGRRRTSRRTGSTRSGTSSCARWCWAPTPRSTTRRSTRATRPTSPMTSATCSAARRR